MAFRGGRRKDIKKQSYYVWFLGAKESKGLRGQEYISPVLKFLLEREREFEPTKVTLQVSNKGIKIVQNVSRSGSRGKTEQIKHFIPHHAVTCVTQESKPNDDIVCCILLIYNPVTRCPVHVHAYRCDSVETATSLRSQLQQLIDRPENQRKFREIETRLAAKGLLPGSLSSHRLSSSDGRSTRTDGSDPTEDSADSERDGPSYNKERIASLYDSLAAELRERLKNPNSCPILLPPRDYDTVHREQGNFKGIERRRSTNIHLVGVSRPGVTKLESNSSGKSSSGIGSDELLSSTTAPDVITDEVVDPGTSSSDEEWIARRPKAHAIRDDPRWEQIEKRLGKFNCRDPSVPSPIAPNQVRMRDPGRRAGDVVQQRTRDPRPLSFPGERVLRESHVPEKYIYPHPSEQPQARPAPVHPLCRKPSSPGRIPLTSRRSASPESYGNESRKTPAEPRYPAQYPPERGHSPGYYNYPKNHPKDYRHSFVEPLHRRIPF